MIATQIIQSISGCKKTLQAISFVALIVCAAPPILFYLDRIDMDAMKRWMLIGTIVWFAVTPLWMKK